MNIKSTKAIELVFRQSMKDVKFVANDVLNDEKAINAFFVKRKCFFKPVSQAKLHE